MRNGSRWLQATVYLRVHRWTDWALLAAALLSYGVITRLMTLSVVLDKWANAWQQTWWVVLLGLLLGALEDLCVCVCMCATLWTFDYVTLKSPAERHETTRKRRQRQEALADKDRAADVEQGLQSSRQENEAPAWMEAVELTEQFGRLAVLPTIVGLIALNPVLSEPVRLGTGVQFIAARSSSGSLKPMSAFIEQETELSQLFDENSLYRRTLAFDGPLAFDIKVGRDERPNVLLLVMESFRMQDSQFLLNSGLAGGIEAATASLLPENVTLTPNFDRWASRGVALRNMWSTWRTSRSLETLLFGQLPYDSVTETGTTSGHTDTNLSGLPQLFKAKGYDTMFTTGTRLDYDSWDKFLPSHGFDSVLDHWGVVDIIENELKLDWEQGNHMLTYWGIHDDMSYTALSHSLRKRQFAQNVAKQRAEQKTATAKAKTRANETELDLPDTNVSTNPWFATHYTISNHVPFNERPDWFFHYVNEHREEMATLSPLYEGHEHEELIRDYVEMRFFSDMVFGAFMEQLEKEGVLKDTIVVVVGDHGQAPERGSATPEQDQIGTSRIAGAIIAEGRIQRPVVIEDVASQSDLLNTLADIVGLPVGGLLQSGIGRSLKRVPPKGFGKRVAFSNNPATNLAAMLGHLRLHFFADGSDAVRAYHTQRDPQQKYDLMGELSSERVHELLQICDDGRALNAYFKHRWDHNCLLQPTC
ncbi:hypothetical protein BBO99_00007999 [Phytophthora kernoviae]|uniref:Sulfatase N-terminal domain-containing protein n=2 Tax=Phytophthora kernoviae TaxID=325452 RepID=A0A3R7J842_9STRA|nr:hypothetical protein G195_009143 [Phytophthora kernoviae 00238/432]KAG2516486.1 hypothetical protein JM16_007644 [Phytophthora kernoviae]KAG2519417.1 hypothetical protein JM18_007545 [Phytophthora kernoviae]RLN37295.1 hypothetical protein BBI17_007950 [Phytophthora kernoviae]RLN75865.1 hypothetical protein BBO99_00007999 [Phytophthora kernoviae]